jgi:hypothetical protein
MAFGASLDSKLKSLGIAEDGNDIEDSLIIGIDFGTT